MQIQLFQKRWTRPFINPPNKRKRKLSNQDKMQAVAAKQYLFGKNQKTEFLFIQIGVQLRHDFCNIAQLISICLSIRYLL